MRSASRTILAPALELSADLIDCDLGAYPNVQRWLGNMKKLNKLNEINQVFSGFAAGNKRQGVRRAGLRLHLRRSLVPRDDYQAVL